MGFLDEIQNALGSVSDTRDLPAMKKIRSERDPLARSAMIDIARYQGLVDPERGALLSRHATGGAAGQGLGPVLGGLAGGASGLLLEGGKMAGAALPRLARGTMWENDPTSSKMSLSGAIARILAATKGGAFPHRPLGE